MGGKLGALLSRGPPPDFSSPDPVGQSQRRPLRSNAFRSRAAQCTARTHCYLRFDLRPRILRLLRAPAARRAIIVVGAAGAAAAFLRREDFRFPALRAVFLRPVDLRAAFRRPVFLVAFFRRVALLRAPAFRTVRRAFLRAPLRFVLRAVIGILKLPSLRSHCGRIIRNDTMYAQCQFGNSRAVLYFHSRVCENEVTNIKANNNKVLRNSVTLICTT